MTTPLAELTTLRVGAAPRELIVAGTRAELIAAALEAWDDERWYLLGGGSNTLAGDEPFDGTVVLVRTSGVEVHENGTERRLIVQAGHNWDDLVAMAVQRGWAGIEALSGIPGTVGAAPVQNIGAYGQEVAETITGVEFLDSATGDIVWLRPAELGFGYRASAFKPANGAAELAGVVLAVEFTLQDTAGQSLPIHSAQLAAALGVADGERVGLGQLRESVLALRARKGMVLDPADPDTASAGSFFLNPIVSARAVGHIPADAPRYAVEVDTPPLVVPLSELAHSSAQLDAPFADEPRRVKLSAAWLIEHAGVTKGFALPGSRAAVSSKHSLAITNRGGATAEQIAELARFIQSRVSAEFGVWLEPEPVWLNVER